MTVETFVESLSHAEKLLAMELIWRDLSAAENTVDSPEWHNDIVNARLQNPAQGVSLGLEDSLKEIQGIRNAGKTSA